MVRQHRDWQALVRFSLGATKARLRSQGDLARSLDRVGQRKIVGRATGTGMKDVEDDFFRTLLVERIDQPGLRGTWPWPIIDLAEALFIDLDQHDVAAYRLLVHAVASGSKHVLDRLADACNAEQQCDHQRPPQQLQPLAARFGRIGRICRHSNPFLPPHARERLANRKPCIKFARLTVLSGDYWSLNSASTGGESPAKVGARPTRRAASAMDFISILSIFVLACFVGYFVVWSVTPALHTPLMAVTNAISSVIIVGALIAAAAAGNPTAKWLGLVAVALASVNIFGGFAVTARMLAMYKKKER